MDIDLHVFAPLVLAAYNRERPGYDSAYELSL
jgi:hypothetical protein